MAKVVFEATESEEQQALFEWAEMMQFRYPELCLLYHVPNGGKRDKGTARKLKKEGVKSGVPDLCLPVPKGRYHGLYIELKTQHGVASENQNNWLDALTKQGYKACVCHGWVAASTEIESYLRL